MMDLDEELSLQIRTVFDHFDDGQSDIGWAMLRTKYPEEPSRKFPLYWFIGIAASLMLIGGLWFFEKPAPQPEISQSIVEQQQAPKPIIEKSVVQPESTAKKGKVIIDHQVATQKSSENIKAQTQEQSIIQTSPLIVNGKLNLLENKGLPNQNLFLNKNESQLPLPLPITKAPNAIVLTEIESLKINPQLNKVQIKPNLSIITKIEVPTLNQQLSGNQQITNPAAQVKLDGTKMDSALSAEKDVQVAKIIEKEPAVPLQPKKTTEEFLNEQSKIAAAKVKQKDKKNRNFKNSYEVFTGTFLNYYDDNDIKVNAGFGLNANVKISKSLYLSVGAGVSQNKISYQNYTPNSGSKKLQADLSAAPNSYSIVNPGSAYLLQSGVVSNVQLNAQLLSLDLPISLKFYPTRKQNLYISTGLNSNSYFAQKYDFTYTIITASSLLSNSKFDREETEKSKFKGFNLANSAIFAIGINQRIGKSNNLIFEPYFKPVIGYMGEKNLKINSAGLNLKFSFGNPTKKIEK